MDSRPLEIALSAERALLWQSSRVQVAEVPAYFGHISRAPPEIARAAAARKKAADGAARSTLRMANATCSLSECLDECREDCIGAAACPEAFAQAAQDALFPAAELSTLKTVTILSSFVSVLGSAFIIVTYHRLGGPTPRSAQFRIVYFLSISDLFSSLVYIIDGFSPNSELVNSHCPDPFCAFKAVMNQFWGLAAILWSACVSFNIELNVLDSSKLIALLKPAGQAAPADARAGPSLGLTALLGGVGTLGAAGQWCWIRDDHPAARALGYYVWLVAVLIYALVVFVRVRRHMRRMRRDASQIEGPAGTQPAPVAMGGAERELHARFVKLTLIFLTVHLSQIVNRTQEVVAPGAPSFLLYFLHSLLSPLQGLGNALVYGNAPRVRTHYSQAFAATCPKASAWLSRLAARSATPITREIEVAATPTPAVTPGV